MRAQNLQAIKAILRAKRPTLTVQVSAVAAAYRLRSCALVSTDEAGTPDGGNRQSWDIRAEVARREMAHNQQKLYPLKA